MKKICLLLVLGLLVQPVFSATYYYKVANNRYVTPYSSTNFMLSPRKFSNVDINNPDMLFIQGLLAGTALYSGRLNPSLTPALRTSRGNVLSYLDPYIVRIDGVDYVLVKDSKDSKVIDYYDNVDDPNVNMLVEMNWDYFLELEEE